MSSRAVFLMVLLAFVVALAVVIGNRMSADAMAVVVGVTCGVAASIPMSAVILILIHRRDRRPEMPPLSRENYPPVVVISPGQQRQTYGTPSHYVPSMGEALPPRQFNIVGEE
jgi:hypothetical protein